MARMEQLFGAIKRTQATGIGTPVLDMAQEWKGMGENLFKSLADCFSDIESRERNLVLVGELLEKQLKDLEEKESRFDRKKEELKLREEKLDEQLKLVHEHIENLEVSQSEVEGLRLRECEKLKEIEKREREIDLFRGELEKRLREVEKREKEFVTFNRINGEKLRELALKEEGLSRKKEEFVEEVKLVDERLREKQKLGRRLIEKLESAVNMLEGMKVKLDERFKEMEAWQALAYESLSEKVNEADLIRGSLEKRFKELEKIEREINLFREDKTRNLESKEGQIGTMRTKVGKDVKMREDQLPEQQKMGDQLLKSSEEKVAKKLNKIEPQEVTLNVVCETVNASAKDGDLNRESENKWLRESIAYKGQHVDCRTREVELEGNVHDIQELKQLEKTKARFTIDPQESANLKHSLDKDEKALEMFINGTDEDLDLMDDEIFKILSLSSDPAKFVLDVVGGFYTSHLDNGCKEFRWRKVDILLVLLGQLIKTSPNIQPFVRESAAKLALEWKSTMIPTTENQLVVLAFLHLLAAYNLSSYFDKNELFSLVKLVAQHEQTPALCSSLGLAEKIPGIIHTLINEKRYLLASTYIYECGLENMFPQRAVLDYYVKHAKLSAKAKCRRGNKYSEAKGSAIASEICDLRVAIEHIVKYGLESVYSPNSLTSKIKQLERNQASLSYTSPSSSSADIHKQGNRKICFWDANKRTHEEAATGPKSQYYPAWKAQNQKSETERYPGGFRKQHPDLVDEVPMRNPRKRRRKNWAPLEQQ